MRGIIDNDNLTLFFRIAIGVIFMVASFYKIIDPITFAKSIWYYHLVPGNIINLMVLILPWVELLCGIAIIIGYQYRGAVMLVNVMMVIFIVALSSAIFRGISIDCGCFKAAQATNNSAVVALLWDVLFIIMSLQLFLSRSKKWVLQK